MTRIDSRHSRQQAVADCSLLSSSARCGRHLRRSTDSETSRIAHYSNLEEERKANKRFLELETYDTNSDFIEAIEKLGCECAVTANRVKMILVDGVEIRDIYRLAAERRGSHPPPQLPARHA